MERNIYRAIILIILGMLIVVSPALAQSDLIEFREENIKSFRLVKSELAVYFDLNLSTEEISQINESYGLIPLDEGYAKSHLQVVILPAGSDGKKIRQQLNSRSDVLFANPIFHDPSRPDHSWITCCNKLDVVFHQTTLPSEITAFESRYQLKTVKEKSLVRKQYQVASSLELDPFELAKEIRDKETIVEMAWESRIGLNAEFFETLPQSGKDADFSLQWHLKNTGQGGGISGADIDATFAWDLSFGSNQIIGVIDEGVDPHSDLKDANGQSKIINGYTVPEGDPNLYYFSETDHGTRLAGIIAATLNNAGKTVGVAPQAKILNLKIVISETDPLPVIDYDKIDDALAVAITQYPQVRAIAQASDWNGASPYQKQDIRNEINLGNYLLFCASGNWGTTISHFPANEENDKIVTVGATTNQDIRWTGSRYGNPLDIVAPGVDIYTIYASQGDGYEGYGYVTGTSFAAPMAAGIAGLLVALNSNSTLSQIRQYIEITCEKIGGVTYSNVPGHPNGTWNSEYGYGRINGDAAVLALASRLNLWSNSGNATANNNGRRMTYSGSSYHLVYESAGEIYYMASNDGGTTWGAAQRLSLRNGNNKYPTLVVNGTKIYVLWQRYTSGSNYTIYFRNNLGSSWGSTISLGSISCSSPNNPLPALTVKEVRISGGVRKIRLVADWKTNSVISFRYSDDDGVNWASAALLPATGSSHKNASLSPGAMFDYSFLDIYVSYDNGSNIYLNKYHTNLGTNNTTWGSAETVPGSAGTTATYSQVTSDDMPHAYVVWQGIDPLSDLEAVYYQRKSGIDGSWSTVLCYVEEFYQQPTITNLASGNLALLWDLADYYVYKATYTKSCNTWSSAQRMGNGFNPNPSVSFGNYNPPSAAKYIYTSGFSAPYEIKMSTETLQKPMVAEAEYHRRVMVADTTDAVFFIDLSNVQLQAENGDMKPMEFVAVNDTLPGLTAENLWQHLETKPIIITGDADSLGAEIGIYGQNVNRLVDSSLSAIVINFVLVDASSGQTLLMLSEPKRISAAGKLIFQHHADITSHAGKSLILRPMVQGLISKRQDLLYSLVHVYYCQKLGKYVGQDRQNIEQPLAKIEYYLTPNYPNPFNPITRIKYSIAAAAAVRLRIYDLLGREVAILANQHQPAGSHEVTFDASHLASGIYVYRIEAGSFIASKNWR